MDIPTPYWTQVDLVSAPAPKPLFEAPEEADAPAVSETAAPKAEEAPVVKNTKNKNDLKKKKALQKKKAEAAKKKKEAEEEAKKKQDELEKQKKEENPKKATGKDAPMWASRNLTKHAPSGDQLAVLIRFDVMRGTEWAPRSAKVLKSLPDYKMIVGDRKTPLEEKFDLLFITTSNPKRISATHLIAKSIGFPRKQLMDYLNQPNAPVQWAATEGGALGSRRPGKHVIQGDPRVYFIPFDPWVVLATPPKLGALLKPGSGNIQTVKAKKGASPAWIKKLPSLDKATSGKQAPILLLSANSLPRRIRLPDGSIVRPPKQASMAVELAKIGFYARGIMKFDDPEQANAFILEAEKRKVELDNNWAVRAVLSNLHVWHAIKNVQFKQNGPNLTYSTSISIADARALLSRAGDMAENFFGE